MLPGWYSDRWWENSADTSCSKHDIKLAAGNYLATRPIPIGDSTTPTIAGKVSNSFPPLEVKRNGLRFRVGLNWVLSQGTKSESRHAVLMKALFSRDSTSGWTGTAFRPFLDLACFRKVFTMKNVLQSRKACLGIVFTDYFFQFSMTLINSQEKSPFTFAGRALISLVRWINLLTQQRDFRAKIVNF